MTLATLTQFFKSTKSDRNFTVIAFDATTHKRIETYGGYSAHHALCMLSQYAAKGYLALLVDAEGESYEMHTEMENNSRVTFEDMLPYAMRVRETYDGKLVYERVNA